MRFLRQALIAALFAFTTAAHAQTQEGCFPTSQSTNTPVSLTYWCQIVDYSPAFPLAVSYANEFVTLQHGFSGRTLHVQYDPWYSPMDLTFQLELLHGQSDIITFPLFVHYDGSALVADLPLSLSAAAGDRLRLLQQSSIPHTCNLIDNCGLHMILTFQ